MRIIDRILELFYPSRCVFCGKILNAFEGLCRECGKSLPYTGSDMKQYLPNLEYCLSPLYYEKSVRKSFLRYKFAGCASYCKIYGEIMAKCIDESGVSCDIITWLPLSRRRLRKRGYDQARLLAENAAERLNMPCIALLKKIGNNRVQSGIGEAEQRRRNVAGIFDTLEKANIKGKRILLVDDIVTTGATISEAGKMLKKAGSEKVFALTFARRRNR